MKLTTLILATALSVALLIGCSKKEPAPQPASSDADKPAAAQTDPAPEQEKPTGQLGQKAPILEGLTYIKGDPVTLTEGNVYVVEFWATWCGPCRTSIPHLTEIQKQYKDKGVTVIGVSVDMASEKYNRDKILQIVNSFVTGQGEKMDYTIAWDADQKVQKEYMAAFGLSYIPVAFVVDDKGAIVWIDSPMSGLDEVLPQVLDGTFDMVAHAKAQAEAKAARERVLDLYRQYFKAVTDGAGLEESRSIADTFIEEAPLANLTTLANRILNESDETKRDLPTALKAAEKANTLTHGENPMVLNTYAMALFENGKIAEAITAQEKAIELAPDSKRLQERFKASLDTYKAALNAPENT